MLFFTKETHPTLTMLVSLSYKYMFLKKFKEDFTVLTETFPLYHSSHRHGSLTFQQPHVNCPGTQDWTAFI